MALYIFKPKNEGSHRYGNNNRNFVADDWLPREHLFQKFTIFGKKYYRFKPMEPMAAMSIAITIMIIIQLLITKGLHMNSHSVTFLILGSYSILKEML